MRLEFIPTAGACLVSMNVLSGAGRIKWMVREESRATAGAYVTSQSLRAS